jgi:hypothetical protein
MLCGWIESDARVGTGQRAELAAHAFVLIPSHHTRIPILGQGSCRAIHGAAGLTALVANDEFKPTRFIVRDKLDARMNAISGTGVELSTCLQAFLATITFFRMAYDRVISFAQCYIPPYSPLSQSGSPIQGLNTKS